MTTQALLEQIHKKIILCIGLDTDLDKIPTYLLSEEDPMFTFNKEIIDATHQFAVAYKVNTAFMRPRGRKDGKRLTKPLNTSMPTIRKYSPLPMQKGGYRKYLRDVCKGFSSGDGF